MSLATVWNVLKQAAVDWWSDNPMRLAASLSFYTMLSLAPLLVIIVGVTGMILGPRAARGELAGQLQQYVGQSGAQAAQQIMQHAAQPSGGVWATVIGLVTLLLGATAVFGELQSELNLIWNVRPRKNASFTTSLWLILRQRFISLVMLLAIALLLLLSLVASAALAGPLQLFANLGPPWIGQLVNQLVALPIIALLFALLYKYVPDVKVAWRDVWVGALVSAILFTLGKIAIGIYLGKAGVGSAYGAAGSLVALLVFVYYSALIFFYGAEFTQAWANYEHPVQTKEYAEPGVNPNRPPRQASGPQPGLSAG